MIRQTENRHNNSKRSQRFFLISLSVLVSVCVLPELFINGGPGGKRFDLTFMAKTVEYRTIIRKNNDSNNSNNAFSLDPETGNPFCSRQQIKEGHWKIVERETTPYVSQEPWERTCYEKGPNSGDLDKQTFVDTEWEVEDSSGCVYKQWDLDQFCRLAFNQTIAFWGDSLMWQQYHSLHYLSNATWIINKQTGQLSKTCDGTTTLYWRRDNFINAKGMDGFLKLYDPDVVIMNRGAHYRNDATFTNELNATLERSLRWQRDCDQRKNDPRKCLLFWRTTAPGFPNCNQVPGPLSKSNISIAEGWVQNSDNEWYTAGRKQYNWWHFASQNALVENLMQSYTRNHNLRVRFLDFYEMAMLRPDHHISKNDCLHWCLPGPMDATAALLLHEFQVVAAMHQW